MSNTFLMKGIQRRFAPTYCSTWHEQVFVLAGIISKTEKSRNYKLYKRFTFVILNLQGKTSGQIAKELCAPISRVSEWLKRYEAYGIEGLYNRKRSGRPNKTTPEQTEKLIKLICSGPASIGSGFYLWDSATLKNIIKTYYGIDYHEGHIRKLIIQYGIRKQRRYREFRQ